MSHCGDSVDNVKREAVRRYRALYDPRGSLKVDPLSPMVTSTTLSRMFEFRVTIRAFQSAYLGESRRIREILNPMRGRKIIRSVTQTPASARMSVWIKYGGNKSHTSTGRYTWIHVSTKKCSCRSHGPTGLRERVCFGFLVGASHLDCNQHDGYHECVLV